MDPDATSIGIIIPAYRRVKELDALLDGILHKLELPENRYVCTFCFINDWKGVGRVNLPTYLKYQNLNDTDFHKLQPAPITFIRNDFNWRFSRTINMGMMLCWNYSYVLLMNDDTAIKDQTLLIDLVDFMEDHPKVATCAPVCRQQDGFIYAAGATGDGGHLNDKPDQPRKVISNNFAVCMIRMETVRKIGGLKQNKVSHVSYHHYDSDREWCERAVDAGYEHWNIPTEVFHYYMMKNEKPTW